jgi:hypothetical protein
VHVEHRGDVGAHERPEVAAGVRERDDVVLIQHEGEAKRRSQRRARLDEQVPLTAVDDLDSDHLRRAVVGGDDVVGGIGGQPGVDRVLRRAAAPLNEATSTWTPAYGAAGPSPEAKSAKTAWPRSRARPRPPSQCRC